MFLPISGNWYTEKWLRKQDETDHLDTDKEINRVEREAFFMQAW